MLLLLLPLPLAAAAAAAGEAESHLFALAHTLAAGTGVDMPFLTLGGSAPPQQPAALTNGTGTSGGPAATEEDVDAALIAIAAGTSGSGGAGAMPVALEDAPPTASASTAAAAGASPVRGILQEVSGGH